MPRLKYIGPDPAVVGVVPLQEGWPAADHLDEDPERVQAKLAARVKRGQVDADGVVATVWGEAVYALDEPAKAAAKPREE